MTVNTGQPISAVIELRTHGVSGTPPEDMLDVANVVQVAGDATGRFFQAADVYGVATPQVTSREPNPHNVIHYREGYHWGRMTSGGFAQALWAALLPFAIVNFAYWLIPPVLGRLGLRAVSILQGLVRVVGLLLTVLLAVQLTVIIADIVAAQSIIDDPGTLSSPLLPNVPAVDFLRHHLHVLACLVATVVLAPVIGVSVLTRLSRNGVLDYEHKLPTAGLRPSKPPDGPVARIAETGFFDYTIPKKTLARSLHAIAALGGAAMVLSGGDKPLPDGAHCPWYAGVALLAVAGVATFALDTLPGCLVKLFERPAVFGHPAVPITLWVAAAANLVAAAWSPFVVQLTQRPGEQLAGIDMSVEYLVTALVWACGIAFLVTAVVAACSRRNFWHDPKSDATIPKPYRIWLLGTGTAFLLPLAGLIGGGLGAAATQAARSCMTLQCRPTFFTSADSSGPSMPKIYDAFALLWGLIAVGLGVGLAVGLCYLIRGRFRPDDVAQRVQGSRLTWSWFVARVNQQTQRIVAAFVVWAVLAGFIAPLATATDQPIAHNCVYAQLARWIGVQHVVEVAKQDTYYAAVVSILQSVGIAVLAGLFFGLLWAIYNAYRRPDTTGRSLGVIWDLLSFWPSDGHPLVPPCYARKAVVNLTERTKWWLSTSLEPTVVLCGHSQGSLLMYTTALRLAGEGVDMTRVGLVTYGSQLQWAYGRGFPDMLSYFSHRTLMEKLEGRWFNMIRFTDPIGGPVLSWGMQLGANAVSGRGLIEGSESADGEILDASAPALGALQLGNEHWLPDPVVRPTDPVALATYPQNYEPPLFPMRKHSQYTLDARWDEVLWQAAGLSPGVSPGSP